MNVTPRGFEQVSPRTRQRLVSRLRDEGIRDARVLEAIGSVPRHVFVDEALAARAYEDTALPIGFGQTISQPYVVARMTELLLEGGPLGRVLEIGTGCGYQSAILARVAREVFTLERIDGLLRQARERFLALGIRNVRACYGDGFEGWPERAPFDAILVSAAPESLPEGLLRQLSIGGRMVAPVGPARAQRLFVFEREPGTIRRTALDAVAFVPMLPGKA